jgi:diguanylate cyclase (GGDEF)-like protein
MRAESPEMLLGKTDADFYPPAIAKRYIEDDAAVIADGQATTVEQPYELADGTKGWLSSVKVPLRDNAGRIVGVLTHNRDITRTRLLEREIADSRRLLDDALTYMADGLVMYDRDARILLCNERYRALFPLTADVRIPGAHLGDILRASIQRGEKADVGPDQMEAYIKRALATFNRLEERQMHLSDGRWLVARVRPSTDGGSLAVISDITQTKQAEEKLSELNQRLALLASTDGLTGLVNRRGYDNELAREYARSKRNGEPLSLLLIDVDKFKAYNDTYGHPAGDECLRAVAKCLKSVFKRPTDIVARYGGEEFAAILPGTPAEGARMLAEELLQTVRSLNMPHIGSQSGRVTVSAGLASSGGALPSRGREELARMADGALYTAKASGRDRVRSAEDAAPLPAASNA